MWQRIKPVHQGSGAFVSKHTQQIDTNNGKYHQLLSLFLHNHEAMEWNKEEKSISE